MTGPFSLLGRRAVVTGANSGIGRAIALGLAWQGADVAVHGHGDRNGLASVRAEIDAVRSFLRWQSGDGGVLSRPVASWRHGRGPRL
jgi:NAD(P)-dependent dehydrogenase (short-subunit alcohol dehydrogenase family)